MDKKTAIIFFGIILLGLVISVVSLNTCSKPVEVVETPPANTPPSEPKPEEPDPVEPKPEAKPDSPKTAEEKPAEPTEKPPTPAVVERKTFASPKAAMGALTGALESKSFDDLVAFVGDDVVVDSAAATVKKIVESPALSIDAEKPVSEISKAAKSVRWAVNYVTAEEASPEPDASAETEAPSAANSAASDAPAGGAVNVDVTPNAPVASALPLATTLYADLETVGENMVAFSQISVPLEITKSVADPESSDTPSAPEPVIEGVDALTVAHAFSKAIVSRDFQTARKLSDPPSVTDERIAALMIAMEEGDFELKEERPLVVTLSRDDIIWVLTRVQSPSLSSEFAVELGQVEDLWKVNGLTFSKVLSALAEAGGGGDIAYSPIVEDPMGGDSLVLYFEFDAAGVTPRAQRQLAIIADILSQGQERLIRINGHADALGTDAYNEGLSNDRAEAIRRALISMGVSPDQVVTESFGETKPRRPNFLPDGSDNPTGRSQNRRAEVYLDF